MAFIVLAVAALALFAPDTCLWVQTSWVNYLLMVVMFGMGLTLKLETLSWYSRVRKISSQAVWLSLLSCLFWHGC